MADWKKMFREGFSGKKESKARTKSFADKKLADRMTSEWEKAKKDRDDYMANKKKSKYEDGGVVVVKQTKKKLNKEDSKKLKDSFKSIKKIIK